jgi:hypothetical protein
MWKNIIEMDRSQVTRAHAHCMLVAKGHKYTLRIYDTYFFSTVIMVPRTRLKVTLHLHHLSCSFYLTPLCIR